MKNVECRRTNGGILSISIILIRERSEFHNSSFAIRHSPFLTGVYYEA
ncbi:hypothetical protein D1AOALGA4SA_1529 [Olavius algarvensis Delta 1 endosymbiont]|nr:hypothetical protein D1AOALGA4SA_1529 [Olavius algarvensis Delta 1 endosymbiont]